MRYKSICNQYGDRCGDAVVILPALAGIITTFSGITGPALGVALMFNGLANWAIIPDVESKMRRKLVRERAPKQSGSLRLQRAEVIAALAVSGILLPAGHALDRHVQSAKNKQAVPQTTALRAATSASAPAYVR